MAGEMQTIPEARSDLEDKLNPKCFVVSLTSDKYSDFCARNKGTGIRFHHFNAVDGSKLTDIGNIPDILAKGARGYSKGAVGCAMSHLSLWKQCVSSKENMLVFEDDAYLRHDLNSQYEMLLKRHSWELILFGCNTDSLLQLAFIDGVDFFGEFTVRYPEASQLSEFVRNNDEVGLVRLKLAFGTCGYAITPQGAEKLLQKCFPMDNHPIYIRSENRWFSAYGIDCMMASAYAHIRSFLCFPPLVMTPNDLKKSQTLNR